MADRRLVTLLLALALLAAPGCDREPAGHGHDVATALAGAPRVVYQCPMHPQVIRTEPGACPICGMTLQRVDEYASIAPGVPDHASFVLTPERQQLIGVTRGTVGVRALTREIRAAATVANDTALYEAIVEYREAVRARGALRGTSLHEATTGGDALVRAAAVKLRRLGVGDREVAALLDVDPTTLILPGPRVWVYAQLFEEDAALVRPGTPVAIEVPSQPGRSIPAVVFSLDPVVDADTRTVRARALVATPEGDLRPDTFVVAVFQLSLGERLALPRTAVIESGTRRLVFVVDADGRFTPREVELGRTADGWVEVRRGVEAGEEVVTSANFLIDSESRLQAAVAAFGGHAGHQGHAP